MAEGPSEEGRMEKLFKDTMKSNWQEVIKTYRVFPDVHEAKITISEETALHLAISDGKTEEALELIDIVDAEKLDIKNKEGNTPLHLAAAYGNREVCKHILLKNGKGDPIRNKKGETPIFLAARHGKELTFRLLRSVYQDEKHLRRNDGDTILHVTVADEYFNLAIYISKLYRRLVNDKNMDGLTPLHILASKTNAFKSCTNHGLYDRILYYILDADELQEPQYNFEEYRNREKDQANQTYPKNYETCMNFFRLAKKPENTTWMKFIADYWKKILDCLLLQANYRAKQDDKSLADEENQGQNRSSSEEQVKCTDENEITREGSDTHNRQGPISTQDDDEFIAGRSHVEPNERTKATRGDESRFFPQNYNVFVQFLKLMIRALLIILGVGISRIHDIKIKKKLHMQAKLVMDELVTNTDHYNYKWYGSTGLKPKDFGPQTDVSDVFENLSNLQEGSDQSKSGKHETPILIAAKKGVTEMVEKILDEYPVAIHDLDIDGKNVVLLAVENRQTLVYNLLLKSKKVLKESVFRQVDKDGNSALHFAAKLGEHKPWLIPGSALQMQWEIKWYKYVKNSMPPNFFPPYNKNNKTPNDVFVETHENLIKEGGAWLSKTSESCSVVAALVATVAFTASSTVPGGIDSQRGIPTLKDKPAFNVFAISALAALCFSVTGLVFFLSILTSRYQEKDFASDLPRKLLLGLSSLFASIASMLVSFCAGHIFILNHQLKYVAYPLYAALCFPVTFFALAQLSLYFDIISAITKKVPQRSYRMFPH